MLSLKGEENGVKEMLELLNDVGHTIKEASKPIDELKAKPPG